MLWCTSLNVKDIFLHTIQSNLLRQKCLKNSFFLNRPAIAGKIKPRNGLAKGVNLVLAQHSLSRTELLIGRQSLIRLRQQKVAVLGVGGVGSYCVEALARCGIGHLLLVDDDTVCLTNINRQLHATTKTLGLSKVEVMKGRVHDIDSQITVDARTFCIKPENITDILDSSVDYVVDAIDTVSAKLAVIEYCHHHGIQVISCMGAGNKLDPTKFVVTDIYKTKTCPLARVMRKELRNRDIPRLKVVYSEEAPLKPLELEVTTCKRACICDDTDGRKCSEKRSIPASISFVPPVAGFILAGEVIKDLAEL